MEPIVGVPALVAPPPVVPGPPRPKPDPDPAPERVPPVDPKPAALPPEAAGGAVPPRAGQRALVVFAVLASLAMICGGVYVAIRVARNSMRPPGAGSGAPPPPQPPTGSSPLDT